MADRQHELDYVQWMKEADELEALEVVVYDDLIAMQDDAVATLLKEGQL